MAISGYFTDTDPSALRRSEIFSCDTRVNGLMCQIELVKERRTKKPYTDEEILDIGLDICLRGVLISLNIDTPIADEILHFLDVCLHDGAIQRVNRKVRQVKELMRLQKN